MNIARLKKRILDIIRQGFEPLDNARGTNFAFYERLFTEMDAERFLAFLRGFLEDPDNNLYLEIVPDDEPDLTAIQESARRLQIDLEHHVFFRHGIFKDTPCATAEPIIVGVIPIKMLQQTTSIKVKRGHNISQRSARSGQVIGKSKVVAISEPERNALLTMGAHSILKELTGPRADNQAAKTVMYERIARNEPVRLKDMPSARADSTALKTMNVYMLGACLSSDIVGVGTVLPKRAEAITREVLKQTDIVEDVEFAAQALAQLLPEEAEVDAYDSALASLGEIISILEKETSDEPSVHT